MKYTVLETNQSSDAKIFHQSQVIYSVASPNKWAGRSHQSTDQAHFEKDCRTKPKGLDCQTQRCIVGIPHCF